MERSETWVGSSAERIARAVQRGDASAVEVVADHLDHIRAGEPVLNAFRLVRTGDALAEAEMIDGLPDLANLPLAGVPIAVKENTAVAGLPSWHGSAAACGPVAAADHEVVRRLRGAGAVVLGLSRMPELGIFPSTDDETAVTRNPWRTDRTPGGSSGGSAAAVAAGLVPLAHGNDGFGSVRIPAACCGLVGIKPGRGVVPAGIGANDWYGLAEHGILATTVADATTGLAVIAGRDALAAGETGLPELGRLRVAVSVQSPVPGVTADADNRRALADAVRHLVGAGHDAVTASPGYPAGVGLRGFATWFASAYADAQEAEYDVRGLQPRQRRHIALGERAVRRGLVRDVDRAAWRSRCEEFFAQRKVDVLVTPALATAPPVADRWSARSWSANMLSSVRFAPYAAAWNLAGLPAVVVPAGRRRDALPAAVQLVGPPGSELTLLAVAALLERLAPWRRHALGWPRDTARPGTGEPVAR